MEDFIVIGKIVKPQGVKGQLKVMPITDDPERFLALNTVYLSEDETPISVLSCDVRDGIAYMLLDGVDGREAAERVRGQYISVHREDASELPEGRYFIADLIGCDIVYDYEDCNESIGTLVEVLQHGAADVYVVEGEKRFSFPAIKQVIRSVDLDKRVVTVDAYELTKVVLYED